jgi:hypothetical protein
MSHICTPSKKQVDSSTDAPVNDKIQTIEWEKQLPTTHQKHIESVLDKKVVKKTRDKEYF